MSQRSKLANQFLVSANEFEKKLRDNSALDPKVVDALIQERDRILELFTKIAPEFQGRISVVPTKNAFAEELRVFVWKDHLYILVSAALMGRPYDHSQDSGVKGWKWLALHEIAHVRMGHLSWLFYTRKAFRWISITVGLLSVLVYFGLNAFILTGAWWIYVGLWALQTIVGLKCELDADRYATQSINDPEVLKDAENSLYRMGIQLKRDGVLKTFSYLINSIFIDSHPPCIIRRALLRKKATMLREAI